MSGKRSALYPAGMTADGRIVVGGTFVQADTYGLPIEVSFIISREMNLQIGWANYAADALHAGRSLESVEETIVRCYRDGGEAVPAELLKKLWTLRFLGEDALASLRTPSRKERNRLRRLFPEWYKGALQELREAWDKHLKECQ